MRGGLVRRHEAWVEDAVVVVYAAKILGRLVPELFRVVVAREVLHQVTLVPVELVDSVSELFDSREILDLRGSMFEVGRLQELCFLTLSLHEHTISKACF